MRGSEGKRLTDGYAIVVTAFGGKRVAARWVTRTFWDSSAVSLVSFANEREYYDETSDHQWRTVGFIDDA